MFLAICLNTTSKDRSTWPMVQLPLSSVCLDADPKAPHYKFTSMSDLLTSAGLAHQPVRSGTGLVDTGFVVNLPSKTPTTVSSSCQPGHVIISHPVEESKSTLSLITNEVILFS